MGRGASPCQWVMRSIEFKQFVNFLVELGFINISVMLSTYQYIYIYIYISVILSINFNFFHPWLSFSLWCFDQRLLSVFCFTSVVCFTMCSIFEHVTNNLVQILGVLLSLLSHQRNFANFHNSASCKSPKIPTDLKTW